MTRRPAWTRRTASASWRAGVSLTTKPDAPGVERPADVARPAEGRHDQRPHAGQLGAHGRGGVDAGEAGHLDVEQAHLGSRGAGGGDHLVAATDLGDDLEVGLEVEQRGERATHERLVVGEQQPDHGSATSTRVPGRGRADAEGAAGAGDPLAHAAQAVALARRSQPVPSSVDGDAARRRAR